MINASFSLHIEADTKFQVQDYGRPCLAIGNHTLADGTQVLGDVCIHMPVDRLIALAAAVNSAIAALPEADRLAA